MQVLYSSNDALACNLYVKRNVRSKADARDISIVTHRPSVEANFDSTHMFIGVILSNGRKAWFNA